jgi:hypothetical protein
MLELEIDIDQFNSSLNYDRREVEQSILSLVDEESLYYFYLLDEKGSLKLNMCYNTPWRNDRVSSLNVYQKEGRILWKDMARGDCGNIFDLVSKLIRGTFLEAVENIKQVFELDTTEGIVLKPIVRVPTQVIKNEYTWSSEESKKASWYFTENFIRQSTLDLFGVNNVHCMYKNKRLYDSATTSNPIYFYEVKGLDNEMYGKFYRPYAKEKFQKFKSNYKSGVVVEGYHQLPEKGELLIIDKSLKDVMVCYEMGWPAIAFPSENTFSAFKQLVEDLKKRFERIIIMTDNDVPGKQAAEKMKSFFNINESYFLPEDLTKDKFDLVKKLRFRQAFELINNLINKNDAEYII